MYSRTGTRYAVFDRDQFFYVGPKLWVRQKSFRRAARKQKKERSLAFCLPQGNKPRHILCNRLHFLFNVELFLNRIQRVVYTAYSSCQDQFGGGSAMLLTFSSSADSTVTSSSSSPPPQWSFLIVIIVISTAVNRPWMPLTVWFSRDIVPMFSAALASPPVMIAFHAINVHNDIAVSHDGVVWCL